MLTRLKVSGFKNLVDIDVRFGPFTCVAGVNGVGKSNLFDAIQFLSLLADRPLMEAAREVRGGRTAGVLNLFHRVGEHAEERMSFAVEMIVPRFGLDDFGQEAEATSTFLRYELDLGYCGADSSSALGSIEILKESLTYITQGDAFRHLKFEHSKSRWRDSVVKNDRSGQGFISTEGKGSNRKIRLHQDGGSAGRPVSFAAERLPRTILSRSNAAESPTALLARREMQSWRLLQLEPTALRQSDPFNAPSRLGSDGSHLAATLYRLARQEAHSDNGSAGEVRLYSRVANRLSELFEDVTSLWVDRDEKRELYTIHVRTQGETPHPAPALSDGSLRFLALAVLELDREDKGLLCLEEPENGVHPERLPAMLRLLQDIAVDPMEKSGPDNPLRQVIINTHSPAVVQQIPEESLLVAVPQDVMHDSARTKAVTFRALAGTWRQKDETARPALSPGSLLTYLRPVTVEGLRMQLDTGEARKKAVVERDDLQAMIPGVA